MNEQERDELKEVTPAELQKLAARTLTLLGMNLELLQTVKWDLSEREWTPDAVAQLLDIGDSMETFVSDFVNEEETNALDEFNAAIRKVLSPA